MDLPARPLDPAAVAAHVSLGREVSRLRLARELTQEGLAAKAGVATITISRIERDATTTKAKTLKKLAPALGVAVDHLAALVPAVTQAVTGTPHAQPSTLQEVLAMLGDDPRAVMARECLAMTKAEGAALLEAHGDWLHAQKSRYRRAPRAKAAEDD